jgi:hypothetical protein
MSSLGQKPWHQRFALGRWLRGAVRNTVFSFAKTALQTDEGKAVLAAALDGLLRRAPGLSEADLSLGLPYPELGNQQEQSASRKRAKAIFITARFRSGSTLLWNLFRNLDGFTSYYEPFNERRWFDPATRGSGIDLSHRNISSDYWKEYDRLSILGQYYRDEWICRNLFMDTAAWDPSMKQYVDLLIEKAPARPVLQFNRIDFRLPWFRRHFPEARIVHLYRHPRDQWCSSLRDVKCFPRDGRTGDFAGHDRFYLLMWAKDLRYHFPFLEPELADHPYQLFYYIWRLSYLFGRKYAHYSMAFEDLVSDPDQQLCDLFRALDMNVDCPERLKSLIASPPVGKWKEYAEEDWFRQHEARCEVVLAEWFKGFGSPGTEPASSVRPGQNGQGQRAPGFRLESPGR